MEYVKSEPTVININKIDEMEQTDFDGLIKTVKYVPLDNQELVGVINDVLVGSPLFNSKIESLLRKEVEQRIKKT